MVDAGTGQPDQPHDKPPAPATLAVNRNGDEANTRRERDKQHERTDDRRQIFMVVFTGVIAGATLIYAWIAGWQLKTMGDQANADATAAATSSAQIHRELVKLNAFAYQAKVQAIAEGKAAAEEKIAANSARDAANTADAALQRQGVEFSQQLATIKESVGEENRFASASEKSSAISTRALADHEDEQRANITMVGSVVYDKGVLTIGVQFRNIGQTAARQVRVSFSFNGYPASYREPVAGRQDDVFRNALRAKGQSIAFIAAGDNITPTIKVAVSSATWEAMKQSPGGWVLAARTTYGDIYSRSHWANFCTFQVGHDIAGFCPYHNDQGDFPAKLANGRHRGKTPGE